MQYNEMIFCQIQLTNLIFYYNQELKMGILGNLKGIIYKLDFFFTAEMLRYREQPEYRTLFGGILSISIIVLLLVTFYSKVLNTFEKVIINSSLSATSADNPTPYSISTNPGKAFMFGVQVWHHNLSASTRYFDVTLLHGYLQTGQYNIQRSVDIALQTCTKQHWSEYPTMQADFDRLNAGTWLCLPKNLQLELSGKYSSAVSRDLQIAIKKCTNSTIFATPCAPQATIDQLFANETNFYYTIYFINPLINADNQQFLSHYLQDSNYIMFSATDGEECQLMMEDYNIQTDQSIIPLAQSRTDSGGVVTKNCLKNRYTIDPNDPAPLYATFFFYKSPISRSISRSYQKIDQILSYIGGLFGTIAICLFFVNIYNGYSFEVTMGGYLFKPDDEQMGKTLRKYNFLSFLLHILYIVADAIGCRCNWPKTKLYHDCREEMVKQLDVLYLFRRVTILERALTTMLTQQQILSLHLIQNRTLAQARKDRHKYRWNNQRFIFKVLNKHNDVLSSNSALKTKRMNTQQQFQKNSFDNNQPAFNTDALKSKVSNSMIKQLDKSDQKNKKKLNQEHQMSSQSEQSQDGTDAMIKNIATIKMDTNNSNISNSIWNQFKENIKIVAQNAANNSQHPQLIMDKLQTNVFQIHQEVNLQYSSNKLQRKPKLKRFKQLPQLNFPQRVVVANTWDKNGKQQQMEQNKNKNKQKISRDYLEMEKFPVSRKKK